MVPLHGIARMVCEILIEEYYKLYLIFSFELNYNSLLLYYN